ncbi:MAG: NUDIX domain-containing protein [Dehalococcoidia bacterium]|nr:NUDIX domain-containing protein [Dehalococcoidia bacterium]
MRSRIRFPDGVEIERVSVIHPGAVALVAVDEDGRWLLVRQYRHAARAELLEVPAGTREPDEAPEATAAREVREETGYAAGALVRLGGAWMAPGFCSEYIHFYLATGLRRDPLPQDHDEYLSAPVRLTVEELYEAIDDGSVQDAKSIVALTLYERFQRREGALGR